MMAEVFVHVGRRESRKELFKPPFIEHVVELDIGIGEAITSLFKKLFLQKLPVILREIYWVAVVILKTAKEPLEDIVNETSKIDFLWLQMELVRGFDAQNPFHVVGVATLRVVFQLRRAVRSTLSMKVDNELGVELSIVIRQANPARFSAHLPPATMRSTCCRVNAPESAA